MKKVDKRNHVVNEENIWENDLFGREEVAKAYSGIIENVSSPYVISIDAPYGKGKTFFLQHWKRELEKDHVCLYTNLWENDFSSQPLVAFSCDFRQQLKDKNLLKASTLKGLVKTTAGLAAQMLLSSSKALTLGQIDFKELSEKERSDALQEYAGDFAIAQIDAHLEIKKAVEDFKKLLRAIHTEVKTKLGDDAKIIILIDELDRCRPTYGIEFLEIIKHFFDEEGYVFIVAIDSMQVQSSVQAIYGPNFDGIGYLRRFFNLELSLPAVNVGKYIESLFSEHKITEKFPQNDHIYVGSGVAARYYDRYSTFFDLSFRDIERGMNIISVALHLMTDARQIFYPCVLAFLIAAKEKDQAFYNKIGHSLKSADEVISEAQKIMGNQKELIGETNYDNLLKVQLLTLLPTDVETLNKAYALLDKQIKELNESKKPVSKDLEIKHEIYGRASHQLKDMRYNYAVGNRPGIFYLKEKIDVGAKY